MDSVNSIGPLQSGAMPRKAGLAFQQLGNGGVSFKDVMNGFLNDVDGLQAKADESIKKLASGEITDVHQVVTASEEAKVAFNMMMEIRNKLMDAHQEIMRMRL